jgi:hypothetical protein
MIFLILEEIEPWYSYRLYSYKKKRCTRHQSYQWKFTQMHTHNHWGIYTYTHMNAWYGVTQYFAITTRTIGSIKDKCVGAAAAQPLFIKSPHLTWRSKWSHGPVLIFIDHRPKIYKQSTNIGIGLSKCQFSTNGKYLGNSILPLIP